MAKEFEATFGRRVADSVVRAVIRTFGVGSNSSYVMSVRGRKSGEPRSTPLSLVELDGHRWLVAPYGEVGWVKNVRAAGRATLSRGGKSEEVALTEVGAKEGAPALKEYLAKIAIVRPCFDVAPDSTPEEFEGEAHRHPNFRIEATETPMR